MMAALPAQTSPSKYASAPKQLLDNSSLSVTGFNLLSILCDRAMPEMKEEVGGKIRYHRGDYFKVQLQKV
jgi:hypothetical protein